MSSTKIIAALASILLVVGVTIGVFASLHDHEKGSAAAAAGDDGKSLSKTTKMVEQLCQPTDYKDACINALNNANSTDPKELLKSAIIAASDAVKKAFNFSDDVIVKANSEPRAKMALDDCKELMDNAVQELQASMSLVGDNDLHTTQDRIGELESWLSSVIAYQETCIDGFAEDSTIKPIVDQGMVDSRQLTDNVLAIISSLTDVLSSMGLQFNVPAANSRRLLSLGDDGYPVWLSAGDRKLMAAPAAGGPKPNAVVAQDGSGQFKTISAALKAYPKNLNGRYVIYVKAGIYREYPTVTKDQKNVLIYGDGATRTIVTGSKSFAKSGLGTWKTATFVVEADGFIAKSMAFQNTAGPDGHQAVAIRVNSDMSVFFNCRFDGYQDTLLYQAKRQFYKNCIVSGTVDFMFGYGAAVFQDSTIIVRMPNPNQQNTVTADGKKERHQKTGLVIHNCKIIAEPKLAANKAKIPSYLGRPWKDYSTTVVMESDIGDFIRPEGWMPWAGNLFLNTLYYAEYANTGAGAGTTKRVPWKTFHRLTKNQALPFTTGTFLQGSAMWVKSTGTPILLGLKA